METIGVELVVVGRDSFISAINDAAKAVNKFVDKASNSGEILGSFNSKLQNIASSAAGLTDLNGLFTPLLKTLSDVNKSLGNVETASRNMGGAQATAASQAGTLSGKLNDTDSSASNSSKAIDLIQGAAGRAVGGLGDLITSAGNVAGKLGGMASSAALSGMETIGRAAVGLVTEIGKIGLAAIESGAKIAIGFGRNSISTFGDFEQAMNGIKAVSNDLSDKDLKKLTDSAIDLGIKFPISSTDAANGFGELAKAGFNTNDILNAGNGLVTLSVAGQLNMAKSSEILAGTLRGFGIDTSKTNDVVDILATTANVSSVGLDDLGQTFKYVGPMAKTAGYSLEDMSLAAGLMGNNMIKGSSAGTALRSIVTGFAAPTKEGAAALNALGVKTSDATGKMRPFRDVMGDMRERFKGLNQEEQIDLAKKIVGKEAMSGFLAVVNASEDDFNGMRDSIDNASGSAKKMADVMSGGTNGAIENIKGTIEALSIRLGSILAPAFNLVIGLLSTFIGAITDAVVAVSNGTPLVEAFGGVFTTIGPQIMTTLTDVASSVMTWISTNLPAIANGMLTWGIKFVEWVAPIAGQILGKLADVLNTMIQWVASNAPLILNTLAGWGKAFIDWVGPLIPPLLTNLANLAISIGSWIVSKIPDFVSQLLTWGKAFIDWIGPMIPPMLEKLGEMAGKLIGWLGDQIPKLVEQLATWGKELWEWVGPQIPVMLGELGKLIISGLKWIGDQVPKILAQLAKWGQELWEWVAPQIGPLLTELGKFSGQMLGWIIGKIPDIVAKMVEWSVAFYEWIQKEVVPKLPGLLADILRAVLNFLKEALTPIVLGIKQWVIDMGAELGKMPGKIWDWLGTLPDKIGDIFKAAAKAVTDIWNGLIDMLKKGGEIIVAIATGDWGKAGELMKTQSAELSSSYGDLALKVLDVQTATQNATGPMNNNATAADNAAGKFGVYSEQVQTATNKTSDYNNTPVDYKETTSNFPDQEKVIDQATGKLVTYNTTGVAYKSADSNVWDAVNAWDAARRAVINYNNTPVNPKTASVPVAYAQGVQSHPGGPAVIGERGAEMVRQPSGATFIVTRPSFFPDLQKGTKVFSAAETRKMLEFTRQVAPPVSGQHLTHISNVSSAQSTQNFELNVTNSAQSTQSIIQDYNILRSGAL